jgi:hypothetical protein
MNMFSQMTASNINPQKPVTITTSKALKDSIFWQQQVIAQSNDAAQIARCTLAVQRLQAQLSEAA